MIGQSEVRSLTSNDFCPSKSHIIELLHAYFAVCRLSFCRLSSLQDLSHGQPEIKLSILPATNGVNQYLFIFRIFQKICWIGMEMTDLSPWRRTWTLIARVELTFLTLGNSIFSRVCNTQFSPIWNIAQESLCSQPANNRFYRTHGSIGEGLSNLLTYY